LNFSKLDTGTLRHQGYAFLQKSGARVIIPSFNRRVRGANQIAAFIFKIDGRHEVSRVVISLRSLLKAQIRYAQLGKVRAAYRSITQPLVSRLLRYLCGRKGAISGVLQKPFCLYPISVVQSLKCKTAQVCHALIVRVYSLQPRLDFEPIAKNYNNLLLNS